MWITSFAQGVISGRVIEQDTQDPVIQATASIVSGEKVVANAVTNTDGYFSIRMNQSGTYTLKVTYVGFKTYEKKITLKDGKSLNTGNIKLAPDAIMLKGATVTANASKVTMKADTMIFNANAYRTPEGSVVEELVKRLPGAEVNDDGTIKINGKEVKKILVDGKEFMTGDTKTAMKNLPTNIIDKIRAYDQKSDLARVSGIEDGEEETVLDFGMKPGMNHGFMSNTDLGIGTKHRYSGRTFNGLMKDDLKLMMMASANNVNDMGFPGGGGGGRYGGGRQGLTATKMVGLNMNYEKKDVLKLDGSVRWNHSDGDTYTKSSSETFLSENMSTFSNRVNQSFSRSNSWDIRMRLEWMPDSMTNIMFRPSLRFNSNDSESGGTSATYDEDPYQYVKDPLSELNTLVEKGIVKNYQLTQGINYSDSKNLSGMLQLNRRLNNKGRNLTLRFDAGWSDGDNKAITNNLVNLYQVDSAYATRRYNLTPSTNWNYGVRLTYSEPIFDRVYLQFSYRYQYRYTKSDRSTYDFSNTTIANPWVPSYRSWDSFLAPYQPIARYLDTDLSRFSEYQNYIHTAEVMLRVVRKSFNLNVGVQLIPQKSHYIQDYQGIHADTTRTVTNFSPTLDFRWKRSDASQMRITYRANTSQPSMSDLLDITDDSDPLNITMGNPGLKPSFSQNLRFFYNDYIMKYQRSVSTWAGFNVTSNSISTKITYNEETGGRTSRPENINGNWSAYGGLMFSTALDSAAFYNINSFTNLSYNHNVGYVSVNSKSDSQKSVTKAMTISQRLAPSYRNSWLEVELNGQVGYTFRRSELQTNNNLDTWDFSYGGMVGITAPWGTGLNTTLTMQSRRGYSDASMNTDELIWNAQVSQSFLANNALTVSLQFYDILHQQSNLSRQLTAMQRSDTEYNAITSYGMLHVIYRLNIFGGKHQGPEGGMGRGRGGRGGFGGGGGGRGGRGGGFGGPRRF